MSTLTTLHIHDAGLKVGDLFDMEVNEYPRWELALRWLTLRLTFWRWGYRMKGRRVHRMFRVTSDITADSVVTIELWELGDD